MVINTFLLSMAYMKKEQLDKNLESRKSNLYNNSNSFQDQVNTHEYSESWTNAVIDKKSIVDKADTSAKSRLTKFFVGGVPPYMNKIELGQLF